VALVSGYLNANILWQASVRIKLQVKRKLTTNTIPIKTNDIDDVKDECMPQAKWK